MLRLLHTSVVLNNHKLLRMPRIYNLSELNFMLYKAIKRMLYNSLIFRLYVFNN